MISTPADSLDMLTITTDSFSISFRTIDGYHNRYWFMASDVALYLAWQVGTSVFSNALIIIHGELDIAKLSLDEGIIWTISAAFSLQPGLIIARDWNDWVCRIDAATGSFVVEKSGG